MKVRLVLDWHHWNLGLVHVMWSRKMNSLYLMVCPGCWGVRIERKRKEKR